ncbi:cell division protein FtsW [Balneicella halophila]|uniref:Probable peptidoglycan glycosyltransferase FtsW n=1 Tax=Balneicella halophila TaxID=1537566 RepID=A0A7L4UP88_BALHA|nr:FtsW/RodA/SpoVE family cell cycle protein [Balneicella halophila]PVX50941.1 cell division protein FtsW [Balneicella halophila]
MKENLGNIFQNIRDRIKKSDRGLWYSTIVLAFVSIVLMFSTTDTLGDPWKNTFVQLVFFIIAFLVMVSLHYIHYNHIRKIATYAPLLILILLISLTFFGVTINGAKRWITIPFIGFTFQPSELIKILLVIYVARTLAIFQTAKGCDDVAFRRIFTVTAIVFVWIATSNVSTAILMALTVFIMMAVGRIRTKWILSLFFGAMALVAVVVLIAVNTDWRPNIGRVTTALNRVERFVAPEKAANREAEEFAKLKTPRERQIALASKQRREDEKKQVEAAKAAIATGGIIGKGPGNSNVRYVLPLPYSDYVFAIIVEELGLLAAFFLIFAYLAMVYRAGMIAQRCTRTFPAFLVIGLTTIIVLQAFMNMAVAVSLMPVTGQPLPFVSKGGTSLLVTGFSIGMILSVTYWLKRQEEEELAKHIQE